MRSLASAKAPRDIVPQRIGLIPEDYFFRFFQYFRERRHSEDLMSPSIRNHKELPGLLQKAYSAEKAAAFAYQGHAGAVKDKAQKIAIHQIELDEWSHRKEVLELMKLYNIPVSRYYEVRFHVVGKIISGCCYVIGWFMPFYFAGRLESGNVCEYFRMMHYFHELGIKDHDTILYEMGIKEKEHEIYFLEKIKDNKLLPAFEKLFSWGGQKSFNDMDLEKKYSVDASSAYCKTEEK